MKKQNVIALLTGLMLTVSVQAQIPKMPKPVTDNLPGLPAQTDEWWAEWRKAQAAQEGRGGLLEEEDADGETNFYTGKPYDEDLGSYIFKYRNYSPSQMRWSVQDQSGFPDGANNYSYVSSPIIYFDKLGLSWLFPTEAECLATLNRQVAAWNNAGYNFAANVLSHFMGNFGNNYFGSTAEAELIKNADIYRSAAQNYFNGLGAQYLSMGDGTYDIGAAWNESFDNQAFEARWGILSDNINLFNAIGGAHFFYTGTLTVADGRWSVDVTMQQADLYTFNTTQAAIAAIVRGSARAARRLQNTFNYAIFWNVETWADQFYE